MVKRAILLPKGRENWSYLFLSLPHFAILQVQYCTKIGQTGDARMWYVCVANFKMTSLYCNLLLAFLNMHVWSIALLKILQMWTCFRELFCATRKRFGAGRKRYYFLVDPSVDQEHNSPPFSNVNPSWLLGPRRCRLYKKKNITDTNYDLPVEDV